jgi:hypothetical protein
VSKHANLALHPREEAVTADVLGILKPFPGSGNANPITEYFRAADSLVRKITDSTYAADAEMLGLLLLGVVSAAEFYFRSVLGVAVTVCPLCCRNNDMLQVPIGSFEFYSGSGYSHALGAFEHESFADAKRIRTECKKLTGFDLNDDSSANKAIQDFEILCELRHCLIHARGFIGLKTCKALGVEQRSLQKILVGKKEIFELLKLSHNAVRAFNRFLAESILNRWIDQDLLSGGWKTDKKIFSAVIREFWIKGNDTFGSLCLKAYRPFQKAALARKA